MPSDTEWTTLTDTLGGTGVAGGKREAQRQKARSLSDAKLKSIVNRKHDKEPNRRATKSFSFDRDPYVAAYALRRANGILLEKQVAPYLNIGLSTVDYWSRTRKLRKLKIGGSVRFDKEMIDEDLRF